MVMWATQRADGGFPLRPGFGRPFRFDTGALCLELLLTGGPGPYARYESLDEAEGLVRWAQASRLPGGLVLVADEEEAAAARRLRGALRELSTARAQGLPPDPAGLAVVNAAAAPPPLVPRIAQDGTSWEWGDEGASGTALLSTVARDAIELFTGGYAGRIRECAAQDCALIFVDVSRPGRRRWCVMERCGNRHKVRSHRARQVPETTSAPPDATGSQAVGS